MVIMVTRFHVALAFTRENVNMGEESVGIEKGLMVIMVKWSRGKNRAKNGSTLSLFVYIYNFS